MISATILAFLSLHSCLTSSLMSFSHWKFLAITFLSLFIQFSVSSVTGMPRWLFSSNAFLLPSPFSTVHLSLVMNGHVFLPFITFHLEQQRQLLFQQHSSSGGPALTHTLEGNKFKLLSRLSLENIDCIKGKLPLLKCLHVSPKKESSTKLNFLACYILPFRVVSSRVLRYDLFFWVFAWERLKHNSQQLSVWEGDTTLTNTCVLNTR
jgi:hypothetical protein